MFNYNKPWNDTLDNEVIVSVMAGWATERIAENVGKTFGQVRYRIKILKEVMAEKSRSEKAVKYSSALVKIDGSVDYTKNLKFGE